MADSEKGTDRPLEAISAEIDRIDAQIGELRASRDKLAAQRQTQIDKENRIPLTF